MVNAGAVNNVPPLVSDGVILVRNKEEIVALVLTDRGAAPLPPAASAAKPTQ